MRVSRDKRMPSWLIGLILIVVIAIGSVARLLEAAALGRQVPGAGGVRERSRHPPELAGADRGRQRRQGERRRGAGERRERDRRGAGDRGRRGGLGDRGGRRQRRRGCGGDDGARGGRAPAAHRRDPEGPPAPLPRGQLLRRAPPGEPERGGDRRGLHLPGQPHRVLGAARPGADNASGRRPHEPPDLPRRARRRADQARRRRGLPRALPDLRAGGQVHLAGGRSLPRYAPGRPGRRNPRSRPRCSRARPQRGDAPGPRHQLPRLRRVLCRRGRRARRGDRGPARRAHRCRARVREPEREFPGGSRVRPRGSARRGVDAGHA